MTRIQVLKFNSNLDIRFGKKKLDTNIQVTLYVIQVRYGWMKVLLQRACMMRFSDMPGSKYVLDWKLEHQYYNIM